jgi:hypothetical protein
MTIDKYKAVRSYFQERMPGYEISARQATAVRPFGFLLRKDEMNYIVEFDADLLAEWDVPAILKALDEWRVVGEICRGEGLQYVVMKRGLRLDSSN